MSALYLYQILEDTTEEIFIYDEDTTPDNIQYYNDGLLIKPEDLNKDDINKYDILHYDDCDSDDEDNNI